MLDTLLVFSFTYKISKGCKAKIAHRAIIVCEKTRLKTNRNYKMTLVEPTSGQCLPTQKVNQ